MRRSVRAIVLALPVAGIGVFGWSVFSADPAVESGPRVTLDSPSSELPRALQFRQIRLDTYEVKANGQPFGTSTFAASRFVVRTVAGDEVVIGHVRAGDEPAVDIPTSRMKTAPALSTIDVFDGHLNRVGAITETIARRRAAFRITDANGTLVGTTDPVHFLGTPFVMFDVDMRPAGALKRPRVLIFTEGWDYESEVSHRIDRRLLIALAAYKTHIDELRRPADYR